MIIETDEVYGLSTLATATSNNGINSLATIKVKAASGVIEFTACDGRIAATIQAKCSPGTTETYLIGTDVKAASSQKCKVKINGENAEISVIRKGLTQSVTIPQVDHGRYPSVDSLWNSKSRSQQMLIDPKMLKKLAELAIGAGIECLTLIVTEDSKGFASGTSEVNGQVLDMVFQGLTKKG